MENQQKKKGRKRIYTEFQQEQVIYLLKKFSVREVAHKTGISKSTVDRMSRR